MIQIASPLAKKFAFLGIGLVAVAATGCSTPGYSSKERSQQISRNWNMEGKMMVDDFDDMFLLRPMTGLSRWNIR